jgi:hypothetical protein
MAPGRPLDVRRSREGIGRMGRGRRTARRAPGFCTRKRNAKRRPALLAARFLSRVRLSDFVPLAAARTIHVDLHRSLAAPTRYSSGFGESSATPCLRVLILPDHAQLGRRVARGRFVDARATAFSQATGPRRSNCRGAIQISTNRCRSPRRHCESRAPDRRVEWMCPRGVRRTARTRFRRLRRHSLSRWARLRLIP